MKLRHMLPAMAICALPAFSFATVHLTSGINLTTLANTAGGNSDGTGVWFNPLTGYSESRGSTFPTPLFEDGKYMLVMDTQFAQTEAEVWTEGLFSRGNNVIGSGGNPARFGDGAVISGGTGATFTDLGPTFGNWVGGGHGYIGLLIRDPSGSTSSDLFNGYAEVNVNPDYSITLLSMAYEDVRGASITTVNTTPEPTALASLAAAGLFLGRRRRA